jgi:hypothetical protein
MHAKPPDDTEKNAGAAHDGARRPRRVYRHPTLIEYGSVAKLTQGSLTVAGDGAMGGFAVMRFCL